MAKETEHDIIMTLLDKSLEAAYLYDDDMLAVCKLFVKAFASYDKYGPRKGQLNPRKMEILERAVFEAAKESGFTEK